MPRKRKIQDSKDTTETVTDKQNNGSVKKKRSPKMSGRRQRKPRGDKLGMLELCDDGFATDSEDDDTKNGEFESCHHFQIQETTVHDHAQNEHISLRKKRKEHLKTVEVKTELDNHLSQAGDSVQIKPETVTNDSKERKTANGKGRKTKKTTAEIPSHGQLLRLEVKVEPLVLEGGKSKIKDTTTDEKETKNTRKRKIKEQVASAKEETSESKPNIKVNKRAQKRKIEDKSEIVENKTNIKSDTKFKSKNSHSETCKKFVGAHVSISGGLYKSVLEAVDIKAKAFGLFLKSQRKWECKPLEEKDAIKFKETCQEYGFLPEHIVPHGSYLMNCGSPDENTLQKSRDALVDELQRCEKLGLTLFNFHPGSSCGKISTEKCLENIAESINYAHSKTNSVITVIENMCSQGHTVGGKFEELKTIIDKVSDKSRIGVCLDTCHAFAAGYDLSTEDGFKKTMAEFDKIIGFNYLKAMHINDSKGELGCHLDRHENIGKGKIGKEGFQRIMNYPQLDNIPMILETPCPEDNTYAKEVKYLYGLCKS